jgi:hypothetical protein
VKADSVWEINHSKAGHVVNHRADVLSQREHPKLTCPAKLKNKQ